MGSLDIKSFNELRPGIILWQLILISMACEQATRLGGRITDSMGLVVVFESLYIVDSLYNEVRPASCLLDACSLSHDPFSLPS